MRGGIRRRTTSRASERADRRATGDDQRVETFHDVRGCRTEPREGKRVRRPFGLGDGWPRSRSFRVLPSACRLPLLLVELTSPSTPGLQPYLRLSRTPTCWRRRIRLLASLTTSQLSQSKAASTFGTRPRFGVYWRSAFIHAHASAFFAISSAPSFVAFPCETCAQGGQRCVCEGLYRKGRTHADEAGGMAEDTAGDAGDAREVGVANSAPARGRNDKRSAGTMTALAMTETEDARLGHGLAAHEALGRLGDGLNAPGPARLLRVEDVEL